MNNFKAQPQHWEVFLKFFEQNPEFATGKITSSGSREMFKKLWTQLAQQLNAVGTFEKPVEKWQKTWADYKWGLKKKVIEMHRHINDDEGELPTDYKLSTLEEKFFKAMGENFHKSCVAAATEQCALEARIKAEDSSSDNLSLSSTQSKKRKINSIEKNNQEFEEIYFIKEDEIVGIEEFQNNKNGMDSREIEDSEDEHEAPVESHNEYVEIIKLKPERPRKEKERRIEELEIRKRELALEERKMSFKEQKLKIQAEQHKQTTELLLKMAQIMENIVNKTHQKTDIVM